MTLTDAAGPLSRTYLPSPSPVLALDLAVHPGRQGSHLQEVDMRWLVILIVVLLVLVALALWRRSRRTATDGDHQVRNLAASAEARRRLDDHRNPTDGSNLRSSGGGSL
ncbi:hypothetical protein A6A27_39860 [Micromonospora sp. CB01531]|nr:hypothetical protein A6A27_39860 [Micromonospora sp. CB01531]